ncbi:DNA recombination protein RmuC [Candidatus Nanopelagicales bacterium]|nr:DNA recombination protein RmuC [Candidatus Nanopelagicales bacterium]
MDTTTAAGATSSLSLVLAILIALAVGASVGAFWVRSVMTARRSANTAHRQAERAEWEIQLNNERRQVDLLTGQLNSERASLTQARSELDRERLNSKHIDQTMAPLQTLVNRLGEQQSDSERALQRSNAELRDQVTALGSQLNQATETFDAASKGVGAETRRLTQALSRSETRGTWGEMQLRRLVEAAGMLHHIHFVEQDHIKTQSGTRRPDLVVDLAGGRRIVVDSKVPLDSYLRQAPGATSTGDAQEQANVEAHAEALANHVKELSKKSYWKLYDSPDFVVLFLPAESLLSAALAVRPELLQKAFDANIILATPTTLLALLRTVAYAWQQLEVAHQAKEIQELGKTLHERLRVMAQHFHKLGTSLTGSIAAYNQTVSSMESRVLPTTRKIADLATTPEPLGEMSPVTTTPQSLAQHRWEVDLSTLADPDSDFGLADNTPEPEDTENSRRSA